MVTRLHDAAPKEMHPHPTQVKRDAQQTRNDVCLLHVRDNNNKKKKKDTEGTHVHHTSRLCVGRVPRILITGNTFDCTRCISIICHNQYIIDALKLKCNLTNIFIIFKEIRKIITILKNLILKCEIVSSKD